MSWTQHLELLLNKTAYTKNFINKFIKFSHIQCLVVLRRFVWKQKYLNFSKVVEHKLCIYLTGMNVSD